jgi:hypothetical protein
MLEHFRRDRVQSVVPIAVLMVSLMVSLMMSQMVAQSPMPSIASRLSAQPENRSRPREATAPNPLLYFSFRTQLSF